MCLAPRRIFRWTYNGESYTKFTYDEKTHHIELNGANEVINVASTPYVSSLAFRVITDFVTVGCGVCMECKLKRAKDRTSRMLMETITNGIDDCYFITLTYSPAFLPYNHYVDEVTGEYISVPTLCRKDVQDFIKRLRKKISGSKKCPIRYVSAGEYGELGARPHYHLIIWNLKLDDLVLADDLSETGEAQFTSAFIEDVWSKEVEGERRLIGRVRLSKGTAGNMAYTARYVQDKQYGSDSIYYEKGIEPPFINQSQGIGKEFMLTPDNRDRLLNFGEIHVSIGNEPQVLTPDRYFREKIKAAGEATAAYFDAYFEEKNDKFVFLSDVSMQNQLSATDKTYTQYQQSKAHALSERVKALKRKGDF